MRQVNPIQERERRKYRIVEHVIAYCALPAFILLALIIGVAWTQFKATAPFLLLFLEGCFVLFLAGSLITVILLNYQKQKRRAELQWYKCLAELELEQYKQHTYQYVPNSTGNYAAYFDPKKGTFIQPERVHIIQPVPHTWIPVYRPTTVNEQQQPDQTSTRVLYSLPTVDGSTNGHQKPGNSTQGLITIHSKKGHLHHVA
jgi:hypothetical protein